MLLLVIHCAEHDDKKIMSHQDCTYTKYLTQICERSEEEERKRERKKTVKGLAKCTAAFLCFFHGLLERNKQNTHFLHATLKRLFSLPTYPDCGIFFMMKKYYVSTADANRENKICG